MILSQVISILTDGHILAAVCSLEGELDRHEGTLEHGSLIRDHAHYPHLRVQGEGQRLKAGEVH